MKQQEYFKKQEDFFESIEEKLKEVEIDCPFKNECKRYPSIDCRICAHNRNKEKRDYFKPDPSPVPMPRPYPNPNPDPWPRPGPWWQRRPYKCQL